METKTFNIVALVSVAIHLLFINNSVAFSYGGVSFSLQMYGFQLMVHLLVLGALKLWISKEGGK